MQKLHSGRPRAAEQKDIRAALRAAARRAMLDSGNGDFTAAEVARIAGADPAMINYYFNNKSGLISSIIDEALQVISEELDDMERSVRSESRIEMQELIALLSRHYFDIAPLVRMLMREVGNEKSETHKNYLGRDARNFRRIEAIIRACVECGVYRSDLEPRQAALLITSLTAGLTCLSPTFINSSRNSDPAGDHLVFTFDELIASDWIKNQAAMLDREFRDA